MGLDLVELVLTVEDRFKVHLPDEECAKATTVAHLAALVFSRMRKSRGVCSTARTFYEIRRLVIEHGGIERRLVQPKLALAQVFPSRRRRKWNQLHARDARIPALVPSAAVACAFLWSCGIGVSLCFIAGAALSADLGPCGIIGGILLSVLVAACMLGIKQPFEREFPTRLKTIGDLVREIAPVEVNSDGDSLLLQIRILNEVRAITAESLGLPLEEVRPESRFVEDLGC